MSVDSRLEEGTPALPPGTRFGELEILGTLGVGGFGIVYLARDHSLEREIAIKEYMPSQFALRDGQSHVSVRSVSMKETFELGRRSFVNEAKLLARFDHPSLLKVYRFWEANGTAYMAMPRLVGHNLREARKARSTPPPEGWVRRIFDAVLSGLETLHSQQVWHRDVAPDNIFLPADGSAPILLDFGAARQAIGDRTQVFTAILKPSFAPIEQYAEATTLKQGPWTDFYALAAAMHELLTGRPPPPATARAMGDEMAPLAVPGYSATFLAALEWALRVAPQQRPPTVAAWREVLEGRAPVPDPLPMPSRTGATQPAPQAAPPAGALDLEFADTVQGTPSQLEDDAATVVVPKSAAKPPKPPPPPPAPPAVKPPPPATPAVAQQKSRWPLFAAAGGAVVVLLGVFITQLGGKSQSPQVQVRESAASEASLPAPVPAPAAAPALVQPTLAASVAGTTQTVTAPASASAPAMAKPSLAASAASGPARPASAAVRRDAASKPILTEKPGESRPVPRSPVFAAPEQAAPSTAAASKVAPAPAAAASTPAPSTEPKTAGEACGGRVLFARAWCIDRQCEKPIYQNDPECVKLREIRNSRNGNP